MTIRLNIVNSVDNAAITAEVDDLDTVSDISTFAAQYWDRQDFAYVMKIGTRLVPPDVTMQELGLKNGDTVTLVPDPQGG